MIAPLIKLREKITRKRHSLTHDEEKPFLAHLEDLRRTVMRIITTLIITVVACFVFQEEFFEAAWYPLRKAGLAEPKERNLPEGITEQNDWWRIHSAARGGAMLNDVQRELFLKTAAPDDQTRQFARGLQLHHAASMLPAESPQEETDAMRKAWIEQAAALFPEADRAGSLAAAMAMLAAKTSPDLETPRAPVVPETLKPAESFMLSMKLSFFAGIVVAFPLLFYFILEFILPGLTQRERKMIFPALSIGFGLFLAGAMFAFFFVIPKALEYFHEWSVSLNIKDGWRVGDYVGFVTTFTLIFGLSFELPVVVMVMVKLGLLTAGSMRRTRSWAVLIILIASAILTPTGDWFTMSLLAAPMVLMYESCIWLAWLHERKERRLEAEEQARDMARRAALVGVADVEAARPDAGEPPSDGSGKPDESGESDRQNSADHAPPADPVAEYEQYLKDHSHHYTGAETHPESTPPEERGHEPISPESAPAEESSPGDEPAGEEPKHGNDHKPPPDDDAPRYHIS